jgi:hypothetical protein
MVDLLKRANDVWNSEGPIELELTDGRRVKGLFQPDLNTHNRPSEEFFPITITNAEVTYPDSFTEQVGSLRLSLGDVKNVVIQTNKFQ